MTTIHSFKISQISFEDQFLTLKSIYPSITMEYSEKEIQFLDILTHLFPMYPFFTPWKHQKTVRFCDVLRW